MPRLASNGLDAFIINLVRVHCDIEEQSKAEYFAINALLSQH